MIPWAFDIILLMDPPTVTHHSKSIKRRYCRTAQGLSSHATLVDDPALAAARLEYLAKLRQAKGRPAEPLQGPIHLEIWFQWPDPTMSEEFEEWYLLKPDADNAGKTLQDALAKAEYIGRDEQVALKTVGKITGRKGGVRVRGRVLPPYRDWTD